MKYYVIADSSTVSGLSQFGVEGTAVELPLFGDDSALVKEAFNKALSIENLGALILSAPVAELLSSEVSAHQASGTFPQILVL